MCCGQDPSGVASCVSGQWMCGAAPAPGCNGTSCLQSTDGGGTCSGAAPNCFGGDSSACCGQDPSGVASCVGGQWMCGAAPAPGCNGTSCILPSDGGMLPLGSACTADSQCAGGVCLGGAFTGGYCTMAVSECDPGICSNSGPSCEGYSGFQDINGQSLTTPEICPVLCQSPTDCRSGYQCCASNAGGAGLACLPPSLCDQ